MKNINSYIVTKEDIYSALGFTPEPKHYVNAEGVCIYPNRSGRTTRALINALYISQFDKVYFCFKSKAIAQLYSSNLKTMLEEINKGLTAKQLTVDIKITDIYSLKSCNYSGCVIIFDHSVTDND